MKASKVTRRRFIRSALLFAPFVVTGGVAADSYFVEPDWVKVRRLRLAQGKPVCRFVHFTDLHHKGDRAYLEHVVNLINKQSPEFVCFTGDIMEEGKYLPEALELLGKIKSPLYGVPGNHEYWSGVPFDGITKSFASTGGGWLMNERRLTANGKVNLIGLSGHAPIHPVPASQPDAKNILLIHYPAWAKQFGDRQFDLLLAGHSHGGQVRIPFWGPFVIPYGVDEYDLGMFNTTAGPLYVGSGIGWFYTPLRFNCRPEITVIEI